MTRNKAFSLVFILITIFDIIVLSNESLIHLRIFSKPLIVGSLISCLLVKKIQPKIKLLTILALTFSLAGDIFLIFEGSTYFILGLGSFLIAHIFYTILFWDITFIKKKPIIYILIGLLVYASTLTSFIYHNLGDLLPYVIAYMLVLLIMVLGAFTIRYSTKKIAFIFTEIGAILFLISDSLLALNKFYLEFPLAGIFVMSTYAAAQFFIVKSVSEL